MASRTSPPVRVTRGMSVRSLRLGISGQCDIVEFHKDGAILPVEYDPEKSDACSLLDFCQPKALRFKRGAASWMQLQIEEIGSQISNLRSEI